MTRIKPIETQAQPRKSFSTAMTDGERVKPPDEIDATKMRFGRYTNYFVDAPDIEELYQKTFVDTNCNRSAVICIIFLGFYVLFTGSNFINLTSDNPTIRKFSQQYCLIVFPVIAPIPLIIWLATKPQYQHRYQLLYTIIVICWSSSFIAGGIFSMLSEWYNFVLEDIVHLLDFLNYGDNTVDIFTLDRTSESCNCSWWGHGKVMGNQRELLAYYLGEILLPAATMNITLLRPIMVFVVVPLLKIDTLHYGFVVFCVCISYFALTLHYYPDTTSFHFLMNRALLFGFPLIFAMIMYFRNREYERVVRLDFLHVLSVERAAEWANKQKELFAEENARLRKQLKEHDSDKMRMDAPIAKVLTELMILQVDDDISERQRTKISSIQTALSRLDTNLFTPDIASQMRENVTVDGDTKQWAMTVLARNEYSRQQKQVAPGNLSSRSIDRQRLSEEERVESAVWKSGEMLPAVKGLNVDLLHTVLERMDSEGWDLDMAEIKELTNNRTMYYTLLAACDANALLEKNKVLRSNFMNFAYVIDDGYLDNPYHSSMHAADVVNAVNYLISDLQGGKVKGMLTTNEYFAALVAAGIHDYRHPGKSNLFMIRTKNDLAIQYSDSSVLERMHLAEAFFVLKDPDCDIFVGFKEKPYREVRKVIIDMVLNTDLSNHLQLVGSLKTAVLSEQDLSADPMMLLKVILKCADIGHAAKRLDMHFAWSCRIIEEFFIQGDEERQLDLSVSPFMDRSAENSGKNQVGFFEFIALPFFETIAEAMFDESFNKIIELLQTNYQFWKSAVQAGLTSIDEIRTELYEKEVEKHKPSDPTQTSL